METAPDYIPPRPLRGDSVRDKAREREKYAAKKPFLPIRLGAPRPPAPPPVPEPQNPWRVFAETIPVDATIVRPVRPVRAVRGVAVAGRSRFRKGIMALDADGFTLVGVGVTPVLWLGKVGCIGYVAWFLLLLAANQVQNNPIAEDVVRWVSVVCFFTGVFGYALETAITEARRGPQEIRVFWDSVLEAQFEPGMRWAVIIYRAPEPKPGVPGPVAQLPVNNLTPAIAGALWDAIDTYAPGRTRPDGGVYQWTTGRKIVALLLFGTIIGSILMIIRYVITR
ncbi:MAG: hypothetical protein H7145_05250 [Akkermansiaceae bacterium]|nr:hypothetical protein [Armatimonadota bacterium]